eukprot:CAMPEP_0113234516 /NCGR_PEP_ID=MMETSP0008_2-20120614/3068_1 /TAXON_ID=97485 /ORGANISM="Prymnesium parvum" /LENGTH=773 /DNA_ID=CAMNT_0000081389 /DNA_START=74 /DNA_END=2396 /DNA_ORIENTATION=- /assembly_acc=CAM_ASM_000153
MGFNASLVAVGGFVFSALWAARMLHTHAEPHVWHDPSERWILGLCFVAYLIAWMPLWLLPLDYAWLKPDTQCSELPLLSWLRFTWMLVYFANLTVGYLTNDFARTYVDVGGFSTKRKTALALKELRMYYGVLVSIALVVLCIIAWRVGFFNLQTWSVMFDVLYAIANFYGVGMFIWLLAHAAVELPRTIWYLNFPDVRKRHACFKVGQALEEKIKAECDWEEVEERFALVEATLQAPRAKQLESGGADGAGDKAGNDFESQLEALRRERSFTLSHVRALPIASGRWPKLPPGTVVPTSPEPAPSNRSRNHEPLSPMDMIDKERERERSQARRRRGGRGWNSEYPNLEALEALHQGLRRSGGAFRRASSVYEESVRAAMRLYGPVIAPPVVFPLPPLLQPVLESLRARVHGARLRGVELMTQLYARIRPSAPQVFGSLEGCTAAGDAVRACAGAADCKWAVGERHVAIPHVADHVGVYFTLCTFFALLLVSQLSISLQFGNIVPGYESDDFEPPFDDMSPPMPTPLSVILGGGSPTKLFILSMFLILCCSWSLQRLHLGLFWYRMAAPYATDSGSLAFNSAVFCRLAVMLAYNVDLLFLPAEAAGLRTTQTRFYCQFVRKARLVVGAHDFYLVIMPLLLIVLCVATYYDLMSRCQVTFALWRKMPRQTTFIFTSTAIPVNEELGGALVRKYLQVQEVLAQQEDQAARVIQVTSRRRGNTGTMASPGSRTPQSISVSENVVSKPLLQDPSDDATLDTNDGTMTTPSAKPLPGDKN